MIPACEDWSRIVHFTLMEFDKMSYAGDLFYLLKGSMWNFHLKEFIVFVIIHYDLQHIWTWD
jgi:hypothetical protein